MNKNSERQQKRRQHPRRRRGAGIANLADGDRLSIIIDILKSIQSALKDAGVRHAGVFGSAARNEYLPGSDIDILIDIDVARIGDILRYIDIVGAIKKAINAQYPDAEVDVADHATLKPRIREHAERDAVYAF